MGYSATGEIFENKLKLKCFGLYDLAMCYFSPWEILINML